MNHQFSLFRFVTHQFELFGYQRPRRKVPISADEIKKAKAQIAAGKARGAEETLRNIRYKLEDFEKRISVGRKIV